MGYYPQESLYKPYKYHGSTRTLGVHPSLSLERTSSVLIRKLLPNPLSHHGSVENGSPKWKETILLEGSLFHFPDYGRKGSLFDKGITLPETNSKFAPENGWLE